jgi:two-component system chemotaxis response regulator CheB
VENAFSNIMNDNDKIDVLIVDDSVVFRHIMSDILDSISTVNCVGTAASGQIALRKIESLKPDLLLLDVVMPELDGVQTLTQVKKLYPKIQAIMISSFDMQNAKATLKSLEIGALDFIAKPAGKDHHFNTELLKNQLNPLIELLVFEKQALLNKKSDETTTIKLPSEISPRYTVAPIANDIELIVIGVSTGGPKALDCLIPALNPHMTCPILIVQHMPPLFTESLAKKLQQKTSLKVTEAQQCEVVESGHIYIAQGGKHLLLRKDFIHNQFFLSLNDSPPVNNCRPSVDVLFRSVAGVFEGGILAVIMTGMGRDGTEGLKALKRKGCICLIQDKDSSVVWGMPGSVYDAGLANEVLPLDKLGQRINELILKKK